MEPEWTDKCESCFCYYFYHYRETCIDCLSDGTYPHYTELEHHATQVNAAS